jgi:hypothetical protein
MVPKHLRNVDRDSEWGYSRYRGWVQGYAIHLLCSATPGSVPVPLDADATTANVPENRIFASMIDHLHDTTKYIVVDSGYDDGKLITRCELRKTTNTLPAALSCPWKNTNTQLHSVWHISASSNRIGDNVCSD